MSSVWYNYYMGELRHLRPIHLLQGALLFFLFILGVGIGIKLFNKVHAQPNAVVAPLDGVQLFDDPVAQEVANEKGITVKNFFTFEPKALDGLNGFLSKKLYPIFPPAVLAQKKTIYRLADKYGVPPNVIATIASIESAGDTSTASYVGAQGFFQVMPFHFDPEIQDNPKAMQNLNLNGSKAMSYFKNECLIGARNLLSSKFHKDHVNVYARAMMAYNGGPGTLDLSYDEVYEETALYSDHFMRYMLTAEIASGLRVRGYNDLQIVKALVSKEIDARIWAWDRWQNNPNTSHDSYEYAKELFSAVKLNNPDYLSYKSHPQYTLPIPPGLRIWLGVGGISLFDDVATNMDPHVWARLTTERKI